MNRHWEAAGELDRGSVPFVVVTLVGTRGHAPQDPGAKAIITREGLAHGTVGGGKIEARCIEHGQALLDGLIRSRGAIPTPELRTWNLQRDIGMSCGGEVTFLFETHHRAAWDIAVFGAGHVAQALSRVLEPMECHLTFVDDRADWMERLPSSSKIRKLLVDVPPASVRDLPENSFFVVMTRGHATDMPVLLAIYDAFPGCRYVGVIGSDVKAIKIRSELKAAGVAEDFVKKLRCPMGLAIGRNDPAEIAISIAAELIQCRDECRDEFRKT